MNWSLGPGNTSDEPGNAGVEFEAFRYIGCVQNEKSTNGAMSVRNIFEICGFIASTQPYMTGCRLKLPFRSKKFEYGYFCAAVCLLYVSAFKNLPKNTLHGKTVSIFITVSRWNEYQRKIMSSPVPFEATMHSCPGRRFTALVDWYPIVAKS